MTGGFYSSELSSILAAAAYDSPVSGLGICVAFFSILGTLTIGISVLPQTIDTMRNRQTQTFPVLMYWFLFVGCAFLGIYGAGLIQNGALVQANYGVSSYFLANTNSDPTTYSENAKYLYAVLAYWLEQKSKIGATNESVLQTWATDNNVTLTWALAYVLAGHTIKDATTFDVNALINQKISSTLATAIAPYFAIYSTDSTTWASNQASWVAAHTGKVLFADNFFVITPSNFRGFAVNDSTPGGMLVIGEFFASITSGIVLWIKYDNQMKAKKAGLTEAEYCEKWLADKKLARKGA